MGVDLQQQPSLWRDATSVMEQSLVSPGGAMTANKKVNPKRQSTINASKLTHSHTAADVATGDVTHLLVITAKTLNWLIDIVLIILQPTETVY